MQADVQQPNNDTGPHAVEFVSSNEPLNPAPMIQPLLKHVEARQQIMNPNGTFCRIVQNICDVIAEKVKISLHQAQVIEKMLLVMIRKLLSESPWFWYEIGVRSPQMWSIEQDARRILGKDIGVFMKNDPHNYSFLQKKLTEKGPRYKYLLQYYLMYHAYVLEPRYALSVDCQIPAWVPFEDEAGATHKIMLYCVFQLYPRIFYEDFQKNVLWRKGGILIEKMSYDDTQGIWFRTQEGAASATKIELAWYESSL